jgi:hypothetical protein
MPTRTGVGPRSRLHWSTPARPTSSTTSSSATSLRSAASAVAK